MRTLCRGRKKGATGRRGNGRFAQPSLQRKRGVGVTVGRWKGGALEQGLLGGSTTFPD